MAVPTGLHLRGLPSLVYRCTWRMCACTRGAGGGMGGRRRLPQNIAHQHFSFRVFVHIRPCVHLAVCACVSIMTVILYDRMITPFSPQLRGLSLCSPPRLPPPHQRSYVLSHMSNPVSLWAANTPLQLIRSPRACPHDLRSLSDAKQINQQNLCAAQHMELVT